MDDQERYLLHFSGGSLESMLGSFLKNALCGRSLAGPQKAVKTFDFKRFRPFWGEPLGGVHLDQVDR